MRGTHCPRCCGCNSKTCRSRRHQLCAEHLPRIDDAVGIYGADEFDVTCCPCGEQLLSVDSAEVTRFVKKHRACKREIEEDT